MPRTICHYAVTMITTTVQELLDIQARQLDWYCGESPDSKGTITPPHPAIATELRRRIKEETEHYPRPDMEIEAAYAKIPRGGDIEGHLALIRVAFQAIDPITMFDMTEEELAQALRPTVFFKDKNIPVHIMAHKKMKPFMSAQQWELVKELMKYVKDTFISTNNQTNKLVTKKVYDYVTIYICMMYVVLIVLQLHMASSYVYHFWIIVLQQITFHYQLKKEYQVVQV